MVVISLVMIWLLGKEKERHAKLKLVGCLLGSRLGGRTENANAN